VYVSQSSAIPLALFAQARSCALLLEGSEDTTAQNATDIKEKQPHDWKDLRKVDEVMDLVKNVMLGKKESSY